MQRNKSILFAPILYVLVLPVGMTACTADSSLDKIPTELGGLPANAPKRPATVAPYPAVHDVPPPRSEQALTGDKLLNLERELSKVRQKQETLQDPTAKERADQANAKSTAAMEKAKAAAKKKPPPANPQ